MRYSWDKEDSCLREYKKKKIVFIGAGNIVCGYQNNLTNCHVAAMLKSKYFDVVGVIEDDSVKAKRFMKLTGAKIMNLEDLKPSEADIVAICVPTESHFKFIKKMCEIGIGNIFCEKPFCSNLKEASTAFNLMRDKGINLYIGYQRSFISDIEELKKHYDDNELGKFISAVFYYSKGLLNNGSHALDLILHLFGEIKLEHIGEKVIDYSDDDPSVELILSNKDRHIKLIPLEETSASVFELDIFFQKERIKFFDNFFYFERYVVIDDERYPGYKKYVSEGVNDTQMENGINQMWKEIYHKIENNRSFSEERALTPHKIFSKACMEK